MAAFKGAAVLLLVFGLPSLWAPGPAANRKGNQAFRKGQYDKALEQYGRAAENLPGERALSYNSGTALLQQKKYDDALKSLMTGASDPRKTVRERSLYNSGNALFQTQKYPEALSAYREAVLENSADMNAKFNYELAQYRLRKQQEQQKNDKNQNKNQDQQKQQQQQQNQQNQQNQDQNQNQQSQSQPQNQGQEQQQKKPESGDEQKANPQQQQQQQQQQPAGLLSKQEAERLLDALKANEMEMIKARLKSSRKRNVEKDW